REPELSLERLRLQRRARRLREGRHRAADARLVLRRRRAEDDPRARLDVADLVHADEPMTTTRPAPVRIEDLAHPEFPPNVRDIRAAMADMAAMAPLEAEALLAAARAETGLDDFGDGRFAERLRLLAHALVTEGRLSAVGRMMAHRQLLQLLVNRLKVQALVARHPEIAREEIRAPIVIVGLPRTGTTHLHN